MVHNYVAMSIPYFSNFELCSIISAYTLRIEVDYNPPSDFSLPSPPYYHPASSVTLTCVTHDPIDTVQYQWTSTQNRSFAHMKNGSSISQRLLTAHDAGIHTCTVTDHWGNAGTASTEMSLFSNKLLTLVLILLMLFLSFQAWVSM